jgi:uncharacterized Zn-finger protein
MLGQYKPEQPQILPSIPTQAPDFQIALAAEPVEIPALELPSKFMCEWANCADKFHTLKDLVIHVNTHITTNFQPSQCQWSNCWNVHNFEQEQKLIGKPKLTEHVRMHTLEKPYVCPVKNCKLPFAIKSNCILHGRTRHNRSFKPIFIDHLNYTVEEDEEMEILMESSEEPEEEFTRKVFKTNRINAKRKSR